VQNCGKLCGLCGKPLFCHQNTPFFVHLDKIPCGKLFSKSGAASFLFFPYYNFYKTIDFSPKIGYNGVTKPQKEDKE
jgi:hypothetical protein